MSAVKKTTPYSEARYEDEGALYKGLPVQWDEDHNFTYFIPNELAESKYKHLIDTAIITSFDKYGYMIGIEMYKDDEESEEYQYHLDQIPWREKHYEFSFSWGWCFDEGKKTYCIPIDSDAIIEWAGLEMQDLIREVPAEF